MAVLNLWTFLCEARQIYDRMLVESLGHPQTEGSCAFAAYMLDAMLKKWFPHLTSCVRGGDGAANGGFFDSTGTGHGHYWVELDDGTQRWVADLTADQFGEAAVCLLRLSDAQGSYVPGDDALTREHMAQLDGWLAKSQLAHS